MRAARSPLSARAAEPTPAPRCAQRRAHQHPARSGRGCEGTTTTDRGEVVTRRLATVPRSPWRAAPRCPSAPTTMMSAPSSVATLASFSQGGPRRTTESMLTLHAEKLANVATELGADIIVVGADGQRGAARQGLL